MIPDLGNPWGARLGADGEESVQCLGNRLRGIMPGPASRDKRWLETSRLPFANLQRARPDFPNWEIWS